MRARTSCSLTLGLALVIGCHAGTQIRDPEYAQLAQAVRRAHHRSVRSAEEALLPAGAAPEGPQGVEYYIQIALRQNPDIQAARKTVAALAYQVPVASSLQDPMLNVSVQPQPVQTAAGQQELTMGVSQKLPWFGKLSTQSNLAAARANAARAHLAATELSTIAQVKRAYYELYFVQQALAVTESEQQLLNEIRDVANARYTTGGTSQQDVLRAELEISSIENELITLQQQLRSGRARLARLLHIAPDSPLQALDELPAEQVPENVQLLQAAAIRARPELHVKLAEIERAQHAVQLAQLDYKPDFTLGFSWIDVASAGISPVANGQDAFLLSVGSNVPVYRKRLDASVRSAEAQAVSTARQYDSLRDGTLEEVTDLFAQARSQHEMLILLREDILPKARQTLAVSNQAYHVGQVDFLQLIDNWRQLLRYEITQYRLAANLRQTLAELERVVGGFASASSATSPSEFAPTETWPLPEGLPAE